MSDFVAGQAVERIVEHCSTHGVGEVDVVFHGGEPLLGGAGHLRSLLAVLRRASGRSGIKFRVGMQSNGLFFSEEIGDLLLEAGASISVSTDGPAEINDRQRVDHAGRGVTAALELKLKLLTGPTYRSLFSGFLCVINPAVDPTQVTDYLLSFRPPVIDYLLPLHNHIRRPWGKEHDLASSPYGKWMVAAFEHWASQETSTRIRVFESLLSGLLGLPSQVESVGTEPADLIVIETNGEYEAVDAMKSTFEGAARLGYNIFDHSLDEVAADQRIRLRQQASQGLCERCRGCRWVEVCGGGYLPHRYSGQGNFDNPSVYCSDLQLTIEHLHARLSRELSA
jgi:uncharacterized protein